MTALSLLRGVHASYRALAQQYGCAARWFKGVSSLARFTYEFSRYRRAGAALPSTIHYGDVLPMLTDRTAFTPIEPIYFLQDTWCIGKIAQKPPSRHVDVGSSVKTMALLAQFIPVEFVDIRTVDILADGMIFTVGSILELPFADGTIGSLSSLCVIEHVGLGRYGDPLDASGSEKAARELVRALARGGHLYISVPIDRHCRTYFNAHRAFTREYVVSMFTGLELVEERYIYDRSMHPAYEPERGFGTGLYHFHRP